VGEQLGNIQISDEEQMKKIMELSRKETQKEEERMKQQEEKELEMIEKAKQKSQEEEVERNANRKLVNLMKEIDES
jgi:hypothetical protein